MPKLRLLPLFFGVLAMVTVGQARAQVPSDEAGFTAHFATRFQAELVDRKVSVKGPLTLEIARPSSTEPGLQVNLDRVWAFCRRNVSECDKAGGEYVSRAVTSIKEMGRPVDVTALRIAIRPANYIQSLSKQNGGRPEAEPVAGKLAGDLWWVVMVDAPQSARVFAQKDLSALKLSQDEIVEAARRNVEQTLKPAGPQTLSAGTISTIVGGYYESSRVLFPEKWAALAAGMKGPLLAAIPSPDTILFADGGESQAADALLTLAKQAASRSERPFPPVLLRWTQTGWETIP